MGFKNLLLCQGRESVNCRHGNITDCKGNVCNLLLREYFYIYVDMKEDRFKDSNDTVYIHAHAPRRHTFSSKPWDHA